jgi:hypothetical protein
MANRFVTLMEKIGHDIKVAWIDVVKYLPAASALASLIFPAQSATISGVVHSVDLIQQAVAAVEQKFVAAGAPSGAGPQKLAQVLTMVNPVVTRLLANEGVNYNQTQITKIINAVCAVMDALPAPSPTTATPVPAEN